MTSSRVSAILTEYIRQLLSGNGSIRLIIKSSVLLSGYRAVMVAVFYHCGGNGPTTCGGWGVVLKIEIKNVVFI